MQDWQPLDGSLTTPRGFRASTAAAGIKKGGGPDLVLLFTDAAEAVTSGVFTRNLAAAAPVIVSREHLSRSRGRCRAVVANSGNANACTGRAGLRVAQETARAAAELLNIQPEQVLVASTGVIGVPLPLDLIVSKLPALVQNLSPQGGADVAGAIMTTDTVPKSCVLRSERRGTAVHLAGVAKGAGMIHPRMATMLAFITTDLGVGPRTLQDSLLAAVKTSFNCLTVDGDTSTNDTVLALASGLSGVAVHPGNNSRRWFREGLTQLCQTLAQMIARDGEGAKKLVTVEVYGARGPSDADRIARAIANSPLVKTAVAGNDPNWGRIMCAAGYSGARFDPYKTDIRVNEFYLCRKGLDAGFDEAAARQEFDRKDVTLRLDLHQGQGSARIWTCDFTRDYIDINASYRT
jgi:glutamate N-acetyltransferase/amino-acid N-acetyltransferase